MAPRTKLISESVTLAWLPMVLFRSCVLLTVKYTTLTAVKSECLFGLRGCQAGGYLNSPAGKLRSTR